MASFTIDLGGLDADLRKLADSMEKFPSGGLNPLVRWRAAYGQRTLRADLPLGSSGGNFRGNTWPKWEPMYVRGGSKAHPQVEEVPRWGGVPRWRAGRVTKAGVGGQRIKKYLTKQQIKGFKGGRGQDVGIIAVGDVFTSGKILGQIRSDGSRVRQSDKQLGYQKQKGLLGSFALSPALMSDNNKSVTVTSNRPYAAAVHELRPFAWGPEIEREETRDLLEKSTQYLDAVLRKLQK